MKINLFDEELASIFEADCKGKILQLTSQFLKDDLCTIASHPLHNKGRGLTHSNLPKSNPMQYLREEIGVKILKINDIRTIPERTIPFRYS